MRKTVHSASWLVLTLLCVSPAGAAGPRAVESAWSHDTKG